MVNVPIVGAALIAGRFVVPPSVGRHRSAADPVGAVLSFTGLVAIVYAIIEAPENGWLSSTTLGAAGLGTVIMAAWVAWELRSSHPMVDLRIFRDARFGVASFAVTMVFFSLFGWLFLFTQQMQFVLGYSALQAGVRALPFALTMGVISQPAARLAARFGTKVVVASGLAFMAGGFSLVATSTAHTGYSFLLGASVIIAAGMGLAMAPATESIMGSLPPAQAGVGSAVNDTTRALGGALGVAVVGSIASSVFAAHLRPGLVHIPARFATQARTSIGAAVTSGQHAPGHVGPFLIDAARQAFVTGADRAVLVAIGAAVIGTLATAFFLPARRSGVGRYAERASARRAEPRVRRGEHTLNPRERQCADGPGSKHRSGR